MGKFDYGKAEADLYGVGAHHPEKIYEYRSEKAIRSYMKENGLNPDKYYKPDTKGGRPGPGSRSGSSSSDGCYLTTACVVARGLPDKCEELQTLRSFRDGYLANQPGGQTEIEQYYRMAPGIVDAINQRSDSAEIWNRVYEDLVEPCVRLIHLNKNEEAYQLYKAYSFKLNSQYAG